MQRLILDLRDNPGGPLDQAIAVVEPVPEEGPDDRLHARPRAELGRGLPRRSTQGGYTDVPLIVLVNRNSASASEIVTGAMQDHDRALVVGETTFGKALVQSVYSISNGAGLALTTGRYYTPSGRMIQRPWDGAFDEYLTYSLPRPERPARARSAAELEVHRQRPQGLQRRRHRARPLHRGPGRGLQPDAVLAAAARPRRVHRLRRDASRRKATRGPAAQVGGDAQGRARLAGHRRDGRGVQASSSSAQRVRVDEAAFKTDVAVHQGDDPLRGGQRSVRRRRSAPQPRQGRSPGRRPRSATSTRPSSCSMTPRRSRPK